LVGDRDSEIAIAFTDSALADNLRKRLWREHLGLPDDYPLSSVTEDFEIWHSTARSNTKFFCKLFEDAIPENNPQKISIHAKARETVKVKEEGVQPLLKRHIKGHLVKFPQTFLQRDLEGFMKFFDLLFS
jgi:hypothetical protein